MCFLFVCYLAPNVEATADTPLVIGPATDSVTGTVNCTAVDDEAGGSHNLVVVRFVYFYNIYCLLM